MRTINSYKIIDEEYVLTSSAVYWKAEKNKEYFFLKRFDGPARPVIRDDPDESPSAEEINRKNYLCDRFEKERKTINARIAKYGGGNFVAPVDFFLYKNRYYQVTPWREIEKKSIDEVARLSDKEKLLILKTAANSVSFLHSQGIIHCDIKPENIPVTVTKSRVLTCSLIDFDAAHLEEDIPVPEELFVTDFFMSPEMASYKLKKGYYGDYKFTVKSDVFAMAIIFHKYWSGEDFTFKKPQKGDYLYNAVLEGVKVDVSDKIPQWLKKLLLKMIDRQPDKRPSMADIVEYLRSIDPDKAESYIRIDKEEKPEKKRWNLLSVKNNKYIKGENFPEDAESFEVLSNGNIKIDYKDGSKLALRADVALHKRYITEKNRG